LLSKALDRRNPRFERVGFSSRDPSKITIGGISPFYLLHRDIVVGSGYALKKGHGGLVKGKRVDKML
jgi:hypothetical protein